jgi:hypothetical protein
MFIASCFPLDVFPPFIIVVSVVQVMSLNILVWFDQALVAAREADPTKWAEAERCRMDKRAAQLDMALAAARKKRQHAARLSRALLQLTVQDEGTEQLQEQTSMASIATTMQSIYRCGSIGSWPVNVSE